MCGIAGIIAFGGSADPGEIRRMTDALRHRGPDGEGVFTSGPLGLGHRRLSILDVSDAGAQPMATSDGRRVLTFNGEIYNFREERAHLEAQGVRFRSGTDTEVLLELFAREGPACLDRLRGMFAFAAADLERREVLLARDRIGKKPLYYFVNDRRMAFASEMAGLRVLSDCPRGIDAEAVRHSLVFGYVPAPATGIAGIRKLPAAHALTVRWDTGEVALKRYWSLPTDTLRDDPHSLRQELDRLLSEAVRMRLVSDVPLGAFLSGGVDSSAVVAHMRRHAPDVRTFSIGFRGLRSEIPDAERVASHVGAHSTTEMLEADVLAELPAIVAAYGEPYGDPSCIPTYFLCRHARRHVTVALSGDGGDENFGGYARYPIAAFSAQMDRLPRLLLGGLRNAAALARVLRRDTFTYRSLLFLDSLKTPLPFRMLDYMGNFTEDELRAVARSPVLADAGASRRMLQESVAPELRGDGDVLNDAMRMDILTYLADDLMPKVDLASMAHGLEVRSPFLDQEVVAFAARIPSALKVQGRRTKVLLKEAVAPLLPPETLRKRKQGFRLPMDEWFRGRDRERIRAELLDAPAAMWELFDRAGVERFWNDYVGSPTDRSPQVFMLLWMRHWIATLA